MEKGGVGGFKVLGAWAAKHDAASSPAHPPITWDVVL